MFQVLNDQAYKCVSENRHCLEMCFRQMMSVMENLVSFLFSRFHNRLTVRHGGDGDGDVRSGLFVTQTFSPSAVLGALHIVA